MCRVPIPGVCHPELDMGCPTLTRDFQKTLLPTPKAKGNVPPVGYSWHMVHWKNIIGSLYPQSTPSLRSPQVVPDPLGSSESASLSPFIVADPEGCILQRLPLHLLSPRQAPFFPSFPPNFPSSSPPNKITKNSENSILNALLGLQALTG